MTDNFVFFNNVQFTYPPLKEECDENNTATKPVFDNFTAQLPGSFTSLVGPNGSGKSTFMLLAAGRLAPTKGSVQLLGENIAQMDENQRNLIASFVYQNMEFESTENTGSLLKKVFKNGGWNNPGGARDTSPARPDKNFLDECITVFALEKLLNRQLNTLSKGEIQRTLLAFSLLYGCKSVFLDEPLFALEHHQKETALIYLQKYSIKYQIPFFISMHELALTKKYAKTVLLFKPNRDMSYGSVDDVLTKEEIETAYGVPFAMMKDAEDVLHKNQLEEAAVIASLNKKTTNAL
ncbi:MAG TPA: ABC transporter ATP-binding protein [Treponemataceae bacterium]|nr:ABC transporter ATP-binding protein [Treponemataceae bacterium]